MWCWVGSCKLYDTQSRLFLRVILHLSSSHFTVINLNLWRRVDSVKVPPTWCYPRLHFVLPWVFIMCGTSHARWLYRGLLRCSVEKLEFDSFTHARPFSNDERDWLFRWRGDLVGDWGRPIAADNFLWVPLVVQFSKSDPLACGQERLLFLSISTWITDDPITILLKKVQIFLVLFTNIVFGM